MVYHTLVEMLATAEKQTVAALRHSSPRIQLLAVRRAEESGFRAALPDLIELLATGESEVLAEAIRALGCFHESITVDALLALLHHPDYRSLPGPCGLLPNFPSLESVRL
jgi:HEAT repeat protein